MPNRHERRKTNRTQEVVLIDSGMISSDDPYFGSSVSCYVCATPHQALGAARITHKKKVIHVPLCDTCLASDMNTVVKKYLAAPDLEISEGGQMSTEQIEALIDREDKTEH